MAHTKTGGKQQVTNLSKMRAHWN